MKLSNIARMMAISAAYFPGVISDMLPTEEAFTIRDPDGTYIRGVHLVGTSRVHREETIDGYTIVANRDGYMTYADIDESTGELVPTDVRASSDISASRMNTHKHLQASRVERDTNLVSVDGYPISGPNNKFDDRRKLPSFVSGRKLQSGVVKNLVVQMIFSDHTGRSLPDTQSLNNLFNGNTDNTPTGSINTVFKTSSFDVLDLQSTIVEPVVLSNTESYYAGGQSGLTSKFHEAITESLNLIDNNIDFGAYDGDNDMVIDVITFLHSGYGAEWGGTDCHGAASTNRIWSHKWNIPEWESSEGVRVSTYHISPLMWSTCGNNIGRIGVIAHETGHFFGLPDLYDYGAGSGIGSFGLMANSWGFDGSQNYPPIMSPWSKNDLGWLNCEDLSEPGQYTIQLATQFNECFKVTEGFPPGEYLYIENRFKDSFDAKLAQDGLAIWHIDESGSGNHHIGGYPGKGSWPTSGEHYINSLLQADGSYNLEKGSNRGDGGDLFHAGGISQLLPSNNLMTGPFPNTDSYKNGAVKPTTIRITNISPPGATMTFTFGFGNPAPTSAPTNCIGSRFKIELLTDNFAGETSWKLEDEAGISVFSRGKGSYPDKYTTYEDDVCISDTCHTFSISDSFGDGMTYGTPGNYKLYVNDILAVSGDAAFGFGKIHELNCGVITPSSSQPFTSPPITFPVSSPPITFPDSSQPFTSPPITFPVSSPPITFPVSSPPITSPTITSPPVTSPVNSPIGGLSNCRRWCDNHPADLETKCQWSKKCAGCAQCNGTPTAAPTNFEVSPPCKIFCVGYPKDWWKKCTWKKCAGCEQCSTL